MSKHAVWLTLGVSSAVLILAGCGRDGGPGRAVNHHEEVHEENEHEQDEHGHDEHGEEGVVELTPAAIARIGLATTPAARMPLAGRRATTGQIGFDEERLAHVGPRVSGRLVRVPAALGASVSSGEVLAVVDSIELGQAKAAYLRARAHHEVARSRVERERVLHEERITSEQHVLEAEAEAREAAADAAASREALGLLGLDDEAIGRLSQSDSESSVVSVRAPFAGRVVARDATLGELVSPDDTLFTLADLSEVWVWIDLYERDLAHVQAGEQVAARLDAFPGDTLTGELAYVGDRVDPATRTVRARVDLPNPDGRLKPGMFARVMIAGGGEASPSVLAVPRESIQRDGDASIAFVQTAPGRFERREVELGRMTDEMVEILDGIAPGEEVVTTAAFLLKSQASADELGGHHH